MKKTNLVIGFMLIILLAFSTSLVWGTEVKITAGVDAGVNDVFGFSVGISGDWAVVGARGEGNGAAYFFKRDGDDWTREDKEDGIGAGDQFGNSVSICGDYAIVGAPIAIGINSRKTGAATVFHRVADSWTELETLIPQIQDQYMEWYGESVSIDGDRAIVGGPGYNNPDPYRVCSGVAYIYHLEGGSWRFPNPELAAYEYFGQSVSISGNYTIVGAYGDTNYTGIAYIFFYNGVNWVQQAELTAGLDADEGDYFGYSVSISGDYAVVGAYNDEGGKGSAYIFHRDGATWPRQTRVLASDGQGSDFFGVSVSVSGNYLLVGAYEEDAGGSAAGAVYSYLRSGVTWTEKAKQIASDPQVNDHFGYSVSISGDYAIVGAPEKDTGGNADAGAAYIYDSMGALSLPVTLSSFTAQFIENTPTLCWTTQSETSNLGWNVYRSEVDIFEEAIQINPELIPGAGTTSEPTDYIYEDESELKENTEYWYWLESIDYSGLTESYGSISLIIPEEGEEPGSPEIPEIYGLHQNYPNPFNPNTEISFMMKESCIGELSIYNVKGQKIKTLFSKESIPRDELIIYNWNGKDETGKEVSTGVYYYKLRTTKENFVRKMILMK